MGNLTSCCIIKNNIDDIDDIDGYDKPYSQIKDGIVFQENILKDNIKYKTVPGPPIILNN